MATYIGKSTGNKYSKPYFPARGTEVQNHFARMAEEQERSDMNRAMLRSVASNTSTLREAMDISWAMEQSQPTHSKKPCKMEQKYLDETLAQVQRASAQDYSFSIAGPSKPRLAPRTVPPLASIRAGFYTRPPPAPPAPPLPLQTSRQQVVRKWPNVQLLQPLPPNSPRKFVTPADSIMINPKGKGKSKGTTVNFPDLMPMDYPPTTGGLKEPHKWGLYSHADLAAMSNAGIDTSRPLKRGVGIQIPSFMSTPTPGHTLPCGLDDPNYVPLNFDPTKKRSNARRDYRATGYRGKIPRNIRKEQPPNGNNMPWRTLECHFDKPDLGLDKKYRSRRFKNEFKRILKSLVSICFPSDCNLDLN